MSKAIKLEKPFRIEFTEVERFAKGKGVLMPATHKNREFIELRKVI